MEYIEARYRQAELRALLIGLVLAAGVLLRQVELVAVGTLLALVAAVSVAWGRYAIKRLEYTRSFDSPRIFWGETTHLSVSLANRKLLPLAWVQVEDEFPDRDKVQLLRGRLGYSHKPNRFVLSNLFALGWYERVVRRYPVRGAYRGYHAFGPVTIRTGDLFGFFTAELVVDRVDYLTVYPRVVPLERLGLPARELLGELKARHSLQRDLTRVVGVRPYVPGDSRRQVHWRATARTGRLQVKVPEPVTAPNLLVFLDLATFQYPWQGVHPDRLELAIITAVALANAALEEGFSVGLYANGSLPESDQPLKIPPGRSPAQLTVILESLARIGSFPSLSLEALLRREARALPWGATTVVVTSVPTEGLAAGLLRLKRLGRPVVLILVEGGDWVELPGIPVYRATGSEVWAELDRVRLG